MKLIKSEAVSIKKHPEINEDMIQKFIFDDPSVLGLGELTAIARERIQPTGGRLDILLGDNDNNRYEVEVQLGSTDESHIIRTIEYWDVERKRYPQYDHYAVIVAEEITGRFANVISLFSDAIQLMAFKLSAYKHGDDIQLVFTKVIDSVKRGTEEEEHYEPVDMKYWSDRTSMMIMKDVESIFKDIQDGADMHGYDLKYNKKYIGLSKGGVAKTFFLIYPKKKYVTMVIRGDGTSSTVEEAENSGLHIEVRPRRNTIVVIVDSYKEYVKYKDIVNKLIREAKEYDELD